MDGTGILGSSCPNPTWNGMEWVCKNPLENASSPVHFNTSLYWRHHNWWCLSWCVYIYIYLCDVHIVANELWLHMYMCTYWCVYIVLLYAVVSKGGCRLDLLTSPWWKTFYADWFFQDGWSMQSTLMDGNPLHSPKPTNFFQQYICLKLRNYCNLKIHNGLSKGALYKKLKH